MTLKSLVNGKGVDQQPSNLPFVLMLADPEYPKTEYFSQKIKCYQLPPTPPTPIHWIPSIYFLFTSLKEGGTICFLKICFPIQ